MNILLIPFVKMMLHGGGGGENSAEKVKLPAKILFDGLPLYAGQNKGYNVLAHAKKSDDAAVLAFSPDKKWYFLWSDSGDGWVLVSTVHVTGDTAALPIWPNPIKGYTLKPTGSILRPTDLKNGPNTSYETIVCLPPGQQITILAASQDSFWLFVLSDAGDGWVPKSAVQTEADLSFLAVWSKPFEGAIYTPFATMGADANIHFSADWSSSVTDKIKRGVKVKVLARNPKNDWAFIWQDGKDGWVPCKQLQMEGDLAKISVWDSQ